MRTTHSLRAPLPILLLLSVGILHATGVEESITIYTPSSAYIAQDLSQLNEGLTGEVLFDASVDQFTFPLKYGNNVMAQIGDDTSAGVITLEFNEPLYDSFGAPPFYEIDLSDIDNPVVRNSWDSDSVVRWVPSSAAAGFLGKLSEPYGIGIVRIPCRACFGVSGGTEFGVAPVYADTGPIVDYGTTEYGANRVSYTDKWGTLIGSISGWQALSIEGSMEKATSLIMRIVEILRRESGRLEIWIDTDAGGDINVRSKCYVSHCLTSLQVVVPYEVVLDSSVDERWVTFDITVMFRTGSDVVAAGVSRASEMDIIIDGYAYLKRAGNRAPGPSLRFTCPPFAAKKRLFEQFIAERISGWVSDS